VIQCTNIYAVNAAMKLPYYIYTWAWSVSVTNVCLQSCNSHKRHRWCEWSI